MDYPFFMLPVFILLFCRSQMHWKNISTDPNGNLSDPDRGWSDSTSLCDTYRKQGSIRVPPASGSSEDWSRAREAKEKEEGYPKASAVTLSALFKHLCIGLVQQFHSLYSVPQCSVFPLPMQATRYLVAENECLGIPREGSSEQTRRGHEDTRKLAALVGELEIIDEAESNLDANNWRS